VSAQSDERLLIATFRAISAIRLEDGPTGRSSDRALALRPPDPGDPGAPSTLGEIRRRDRLGGLIHEYQRTAA
jgi:hypothetical protein